MILGKDQVKITTTSEVPFEDHKLNVPGGKVWVRVFGAGPKTPIVILHGGPGSPSDYLWSLQALAINRPVVIYDQLGCGKSDRGKTTDYHIDRYVEELDCILNQLGYSKSILLGHSWGGMLAVESALRWPKRFENLVLVSACISMERTIKDMIRLRSELPTSIQDLLSRLEVNKQTQSIDYQLAASVFYQRHICRLKPWPQFMEASPETWGLEVYRKMWGPAEFLPEGNLKDYERVQDLKSLEIPILFTCGRFDEVTPEATTCYYKASKNGSLHIFENSSHVPHLEEPESFLNVVNSFLNSKE